VRGSASRRVAPLHEASCERHALRLAALSSVDCDQEDGDEAEAEAEDKNKNVNDDENQDNENGNNAGNEETENKGDNIEVLVRGGEVYRTHNEETRATGMNDDVAVDDVAEEDSHGDACERSATDTTTTTKTTTIAFLVHTPTVVLPARLMTLDRSDSAAVSANKIAPPQSTCT